MEEVGKGVVGCICLVGVVKWPRLFFFFFIVLYTREKCTEAIRRPAQKHHRSPALSTRLSPLPTEESSSSVCPRPGGRRRGQRPLWAMCPALWIHSDDVHSGRPLMILIIIIIIKKKTTSPANNLPRFHFTEVFKLKFKSGRGQKKKPKRTSLRSELSSSSVGSPSDGGLEDEVGGFWRGGASLLPAAESVHVRAA